MKKTLSLAVMAAATLFLAGCTSGSKYVIEGSGDQLVDGHWVFLEDGADWTILDSALIENGAFRIEGADMGSEVAYLYMGANSAPSGLYQISGIFFLEPGTVTLEYVPDFEMYFAHGTPLNDLYYKYIFGGLEGYSGPMDLIRDNYNVLGLHILSGMLMTSSKPEIESVMAEFPEEMKEHPLYIQLEELLEPIKTDLGMPYWDIGGKDVKGNVVRLSDVVERDGVRYVLLDLWASWCGPCREENPNLVKQYSRFRSSGFEIYGMSFDSNPESWREALKEFGMNWTNVITEFPGGLRTSPIWTGYGMDGIPWNYLIDASTGEIIAKNLRGEALAAELEALFAASAGAEAE